MVLLLGVHEGVAARSVVAKLFALVQGTDLSSLPEALQGATHHAET